MNINALSYALQGLITAFKSELNLRIHVLIALCVISAGVICGISKFEWLILVFSIGLVIAVELINTAIEYLVNLISPEKNILAGQIKDMGAAAVLIAAITALASGTIIFLPHLLK